MLKIDIALDLQGHNNGILGPNNDTWVGSKFQLILESLGLNPNHLKEIGCLEGLYSLDNYHPPSPEPELAIGICDHTDSGFISVLLQDLGGLQVLHQHHWVDVTPSKGNSAF